MWDPRTSDVAVWTACPSKHLPPGRGRWVGTMDVDEEGHWMACGGGVVPSVWHLRTRMLMAELPASGPTQAIAFLRDGVCMTCCLHTYFSLFTHLQFHHPALSPQIATAGRDGHISHWTVSGAAAARVATTIPSVFSLCPLEGQGALQVGGE